MKTETFSENTNGYMIDNNYYVAINATLRSLCVLRNISDMQLSCKGPGGPMMRLQIRHVYVCAFLYGAVIK